MKRGSGGVTFPAQRSFVLLEKGSGGDEGAKKKRSKQTEKKQTQKTQLEKGQSRKQDEKKKKERVDEEEGGDYDEEDVEEVIRQMIRQRAKKKSRQEETDDNNTAKGKEDDGETTEDFALHYSDESSDDDGDEEDKEDDGEEGEEENADSEEEDEIDDARTRQLAVDEDVKKSIIDKVGKLQWKHAQIRPGVVYVGRIPVGLFEPQMKSFFGQFGNVTRLRISRNPRTGRMRHYGFVEFEFEEVAKIVAKAMNNYILFEHVLKCEFVPTERVHPNLFDNEGRSFVRVNWRDVALRKRKAAEPEKVAARNRRNLARKNAQLKKLKIDYEFPAVAL